MAASSGRCGRSTPFFHTQVENILVRPNCEPGHEGCCVEVYAPHQPYICQHGIHACPEWHRIWGTMRRQQLLQCPDGPGSQPRIPLAPCVCGRTAHRLERPEHQVLPPTTTWFCQRRAWNWACHPAPSILRLRSFCVSPKAAAAVSC